MIIWLASGLVALIPGGLRWLVQAEEDGARLRLASAMALGLSTYLPPAVSAAIPKASNQGVYVVLTGDDSFADAVIDAAERSDEYKKSVQALVPNWLSAAESGRSLGATSLDGRRDVSRDLADLKEIQAWLSDPSAARSPDSSSISPQGTPAPTTGQSAGNGLVAPVPLAACCESMGQSR